MEAPTPFFSELEVRLTDDDSENGRRDSGDDEIPIVVRHLTDEEIERPHAVAEGRELAADFRENAGRYRFLYNLSRSTLPPVVD